MRGEFGLGFSSISTPPAEFCRHRPPFDLLLEAMKGLIYGLFRKPYNNSLKKTLIFGILTRELHTPLL
jgi:hypothetical protein